MSRLLDQILLGLIGHLPSEGLPLPIRGLPAHVSDLGTGAYLIQISNPALFKAFSQGLLDDLMQTPKSLCLVGHPGFEQLIAAPTPKAHPDAILAMALTPEGHRRLLEGDAQGFLRALEDMALGPCTCVVFLDTVTETGVGVSTAPLIAALERWCEAWGHTFIWLLGRPHPGLRTHELEQLRGSAALLNEWRQIHWRVDHWQGKTQTRILGTTYTVSLASDGRHFDALGASIQHHGRGHFSAPDEGQVWVEEGVALFDVHHPEAWNVFTDPDQLDRYLEGAMAPTLILAYDETTDFETLARLIDQVRKRIGRGIKLVLRETRFRIRSYQEQLLYHLGLNAIVHANERTQELVRVIEALKGNSTAPSHSHLGLDELLRGATPPAARGYLPPLDFAMTLLQKFRHEGASVTNHVLIQLNLLEGISQLSILRAFRANRPGDLITADREDIYLFLFGCGVSDIPIALANCFSTEVRHAFAAEVQWTEMTGILARLMELEREWDRDVPADFTLQLMDSFGTRGKEST